MGRKGVSKRKPKREKSSANSTTNGNAATRSGGNMVASLVRDTGAPLVNRGGTKPPGGSNKNRNKGN